MNDQLSQAYDIDNRRAGSYTVKPGQDISATDNESAKSFLKRFTEAKKDDEAFEREGFKGRGQWSSFVDGGFRNLFRATG